MRLPGFKSITTLLVLGAATAVWQAHERNVDKKNVASSIALVRKRQQEYADALARKVADQKRENQTG